MSAAISALGRSIYLQNVHKNKVHYTEECGVLSALNSLSSLDILARFQLGPIHFSLNSLDKKSYAPTIVFSEWFSVQNDLVSFIVSGIVERKNA